jgi:hypothetical protein
MNKQNHARFITAKLVCLNCSINIHYSLGKKADIFRILPGKPVCTLRFHSKYFALWKTINVSGIELSYQFDINKKVFIICRIA